MLNGYYVCHWKGDQSLSCYKDIFHCEGPEFVMLKGSLCLSLKRGPDFVMLKGYYVCHWKGDQSLSCWKGIMFVIGRESVFHYLWWNIHNTCLSLGMSVHYSYCVDVVIRQAKASSQCMLWRYMQAVPMTYISVKKTLTTLDNIRIITCYRKEKQIQAVPITAMVSIHF